MDINPLLDDLNKKGGYQNAESKGKIEPLTSEKLIKEFSTSGEMLNN